MIERKKSGRPKKSLDNKKSERIVFWTTPAKAKVITERAEKMNLSVSEFCAKVVIEGEIVTPFTEDELTLKRGLVGMANNLNQIAHRANAAGIETVTDSAKELFHEIRKEIMKFRQ